MSKPKQIIYKIHDFVDIPQDIIDFAPQSGPFDDYAEQVLQDFEVICSPQDARKALKAYGSWDSKELQDHDQNLRRLVWLSVLDCKEQETNQWYMGE